MTAHEPPTHDVGRESSRFARWFKRTGSEGLGWILTIAGLILIPFPGPGTLVLVAGVALLAPHYSWAQRLLEPLKVKAIEGAKYGVATIPRIVASFLGGVWLLALGIVWFAKPTIPEFDIWFLHFGPQLPAAGWATGTGLVVSAIAAWALLFYSVKRWRLRDGEPLSDPEPPTSA